MSEITPPVDTPRSSISAYDPTAGESPADSYVVGIMCQPCAIEHKEGIECADRRIILRPVSIKAAQDILSRTDAWNDCEGFCYTTPPS